MRAEDVCGPSHKGSPPVRGEDDGGSHRGFEEKIEIGKAFNV